MQATHEWTLRDHVTKHTTNTRLPFSWSHTNRVVSYGRMTSFAPVTLTSTRWPRYTNLT